MLYECMKSAMHFTSFMINHVSSPQLQCFDGKPCNAENEYNQRYTQMKAMRTKMDGKLSKEHHWQAKLGVI